MLKVRLLGGLALECDGSGLAAPTGRCGALLAWLALHPGMHPRSRVAARMWPEVLDESARGSLRTALRDLRLALGPEAAGHLGATRDEIGLAGDVWVDVREFAAAVAAGRLEEAVDLGDAGELLPELQHDWVFDAREAHTRALAEIIDGLAIEDERRGDRTRAVERTRRLVALDPLSEEHARALIRRLADGGDRAAALAAFESHRERLLTQLQMAPSAATRLLVNDIRAEPPEDPPPAPARALPGPLSLAATGPLLGRAAELAALEAAWADVADGTVRLCVLTGEAGIGKSRLLAELAVNVAAQGSPVLYGACFEHPRPPYGPFVEAIIDDLRALGDEQAAARLGSGTGELARIAPELRERFGIAAPASGESPEADQLRLFSAVGGYVQRAARPRALLVIEDVHWAAAGTLALITHMVRAARGAIMLAITSRDVAPDLSDALTMFLSDLGRLPNAQVIPLHGLSRPDVAALLRAGERRAVDVDRTARRLHEATGGNPLFLREMVRDLGEDGSPPPVAASVRDHVAARLSRLPDADRRLLDAAAVLGATFDARTCAQIAGRPLPDVLDALDHAVEVGVVVAVPGEPGRYAFTHAVLREVRYAAIPAGRRMQLHHRAGLVLRDAGAPVAELARHFCAAADLGDAEQAYRYALRAGELARERFAFADAADAFAEAQRVGARLSSIDDRERCRLAIGRGEALHRAGDRRHREVLLEAVATARRLDDSELLTRAALALNEQGWTITGGAVDEELVAAAREAIGRLPREARASRARLMAMMAATIHLSDRFEEGKAIAADALEVARACGDPTALGEVLISAHWACFDPLNLDQRVAWAEEACDLAERFDTPVVLTQALRMLGQDLMEQGDVDRAREVLQRSWRIAEELDMAHLRVYEPAMRVVLDALAGRLDEAGRLLGDCFALSRRIGIDAAAFFGGAGGSVVMESGEWERALPGLEQLVQRTRGMTVYGASLAMYRARLGDAAGAREQLRRFTETGFAILPRNIQWMPGMVMLADAATWLGDVEAAASIRERLEPVAGRTPWHAFVALWPVDVALAQLSVVLGDHDRAFAHLDDAMELCERRDLVAHRARVELYRVWAAREAGRPVDPAPAVAAALASPCRGVARDAALMGLTAA